MFLRTGTHFEKKGLSVENGDVHPLPGPGVHHPVHLHPFIYLQFECDRSEVGEVKRDGHPRVLVRERPSLDGLVL